jgi:hypothetical protein
MNIVEAIDAYHFAQTDTPRQHLGASEIGHGCDRWLWLSFHWVVKDEKSGRIRRLLRRGQLEESQIIADLQAIGAKIYGEQRRVSFGPHVGGQIDAIGRDLPGLIGEHILEFKTHSQKSFNATIKHSLTVAKPMHFAQLQAYMLGTGIPRGLYIAVCKNTDDMYTEVVELDRQFATELVERANRIAALDYIPGGISSNPAWYECKMCAAHDFCHVSKLAKQINCRTCASAEPQSAGGWKCGQFGDLIPADFQAIGCDNHLMRPDLVPWPAIDAGSDHVIFEIEGAQVRNGVGGFLSRELVANAPACASGDALLMDMREKFEGEING